MRSRPSSRQRRQGTLLNVSAFSRDGATALGHGTLELVDNQIDQTTGTIRLKARFPNEQRTLWPGEFINVRLQVGDKPNGVTVDPRVVQRGSDEAPSPTSSRPTIQLRCARSRPGKRMADRFS